MTCLVIPSYASCPLFVFLVCNCSPCHFDLDFSFTSSIVFVTVMHCLLGSLGFTVPMHLLVWFITVAAPPYQIHTQPLVVLLLAYVWLSFFVPLTYSSSTN